MRIEWRRDLIWARRYLVMTSVLAAYLSTQVHEAGHWIVAQVLRLEFTLGFNRWQLAQETASGEKIAVLMAGPLATLALALSGVLVAYLAQGSFLQRLGLLLALFNSLLALIPYLLNPLTGMRGDEGWIAIELGLPEYAVRLPLGLAFAAVAVGALIKAQGWPGRVRFFSGALALVLVMMPLLVLLDRVVWFQMEHGSPLFAPIGGISMPLWVLNAIALVALSVPLRVDGLRRSEEGS